MKFQSKENKLFIILGCFLIANAILAEFIGVKIFSVEESIGLTKFDINLFGVKGLSFNMSAGVVTWPLVFIMTDIINEYYGTKGVRFLSYLASVLIAFAFVVVFLPPLGYGTFHGASPAVKISCKECVHKSMTTLVLTWCFR